MFGTISLREKGENSKPQHARNLLVRASSSVLTRALQSLHAHGRPYDNNAPSLLAFGCREVLVVPERRFRYLQTAAFNTPEPRSNRQVRFSLRNPNRRVGRMYNGGVVPRAGASDARGMNGGGGTTGAVPAFYQNDTTSPIRPGSSSLADPATLAGQPGGPTQLYSQAGGPIPTDGTAPLASLDFGGAAAIGAASSGGYETNDAADAHGTDEDRKPPKRRASELNGTAAEAEAPPRKGRPRVRNTAETDKEKKTRSKAACASCKSVKQKCVSPVLARGGLPLLNMLCRSHQVRGSAFRCVGEQTLPRLLVAG